MKPYIARKLVEFAASDSLRSVVSMGISATERHLFLVCPDDLQRYFSVCYDLRGASKREYNVKATHRPMRRIFHDVPFRILPNGYFIVTELLCANSPRAVRV